MRITIDLTEDERRVLDWALRRVAYGRGIKILDMNIAERIMEKLPKYKVSVKPKQKENTMLETRGQGQIVDVSYTGRMQWMVDYNGVAHLQQEVIVRLNLTESVSEWRPVPFFDLRVHAPQGAQQQAAGLPPGVAESNQIMPVPGADIAQLPPVGQF